MIINHNIDNLNGGVSQQQEEMRYDNQVDEMVNCIISPHAGVSRRNPLIKYSVANTSQLQNFDNTQEPKFHYYSRGDGVESYLVSVKYNGSRAVVEAFNLETQTYYTVGYNQSEESAITSYLGTDNYRENIECTTIGDVTMLLNTTKVVEDSGFSSSIPDNKMFYWIKKSFEDGTGHGYDYHISVTVGANSPVTVDTSTYSTLDTTDSKAVATWIATELSKDSNITATAVGSIIQIVTTGSITDFSSGDTYGDQASISWFKSVIGLNKLPANMDGIDEFIVNISGFETNSDSGYFIKWTGEKWEETRGSGSYKISETTMPLKLARQADGTFWLGFESSINSSKDGFFGGWAEKKAGDDDSNPMPSFVGNEIIRLFFFSNRLCFVTKDSIVMSESGEFSNFFFTTLMSFPQSDPIDVSIDSDDSSIIAYASVTGSAVSIWTTNGQYVMTGGSTLTPQSAKITKTSSYTVNFDLKPVKVDNELIFFDKTTTHTNSYSFSTASLQSDKTTAQSINLHCPYYIPLNMDIVAVSQQVNMVFLANRSDISETEKDIYVYKYSMDKGEKIISAWSKWTIQVNQNDMRFEYMFTKEDELWFVFRNSNDMFFAKIHLTSRAGDGNYYDIDYALNEKEYDSYVKLSRFSIPSNSESKNINETFFYKKIKVEGLVNYEIENLERGTSINIADGGNRSINITGNNISNRILLTSLNSSTSERKREFYIGTINIEVKATQRSKNV